MASPCLLGLPQELRDAIYSYAILNIDTQTSGQANLHDFQSRTSKALSTRNDRWQWTVHHDTTSPRALATYLSLMLTCRQLHGEIIHFLQALHECNLPPTRLLLQISYPHITPTWLSLPLPPSQVNTLHMNIKIDQLYHPSLISRPPSNPILHALTSVLSSYISHGPFFARSAPLSKKLHLDTVRVTISPPRPYEDLTHIYGFPEQQLGMLYADFLDYLRRFARSGVAWGRVGTFEVRLGDGKDGDDSAGEGDEEFERIHVTSEIWDEGDYVFIRGGEYWPKDD
jgi:hypothetical protein